MDGSWRPERLRFGPFVLDARRAELLRDGVVVALRPKSFDLLATLAAHPGTVLSKETLLAAVWPDAVVTDDSLTQAIHDVRSALGKDGPMLVRTVARRGYRFDAEVVDADAALDVAQPPRRHAASAAGQGALLLPRLAVLALLGGIAAGAVYLGGGFAGWEPSRPFAARSVPSEAFKPPRLSIVVLPLEAEPGSEGGTWFSDVLSTDLIRDLGSLSGSVVISRDTALTYRGRQVDPRVVARELNVRYVVRGTVARSGNDVRLLLALIDGETGRQLFAERFTLDRADLRRSLAEVTGVVSRMLNVEVQRAEGQRATALKPAQVEADDLAMNGWAVWFNGVSRENTFEALRLFEAAVAREPDTLRGWQGIGYVNGIARSMGWVDDHQAALERQREALRQMERIDRNDMITQLGRTGQYYASEDFAGLLQATQTLAERFPNQPVIHHQQAMAFMKLGRFDDCIAPSVRAIRLGPRDSMQANWRMVLAFCHLFAGRYGDAVDEARRAGESNSAVPHPLLIQAAALARDGRVDEARTLARDIEQRFGDTRGLKSATVLDGNEPRLVDQRERFHATLQQLGLR